MCIYGLKDEKHMTLTSSLSTRKNLTSLFVICLQTVLSFSETKIRSAVVDTNCDARYNKKEQPGGDLLVSEVNTIKIRKIWNSRAQTMMKMCSLMLLKEQEHRKLGWKVLILKYDLGKSLSKEMWCKMADTKKNDYIF